MSEGEREGGREGGREEEEGEEEGRVGGERGRWDMNINSVLHVYTCKNKQYYKMSLYM